jgi:hypothetical protein
MAGPRPRRSAFARTKEQPTASTGKTPPTDPLTRRERRAVLIAIAVLTAVIAVGASAWALFSQSSGSAQSEDVCVTVSAASSMGGGVEHACGADARTWCHAAYALADAHAQAVQVQCRAAGIGPSTQR